MKSSDRFRTVFSCSLQTIWKMNDRPTLALFSFLLAFKSLDSLIHHTQKGYPYMHVFDISKAFQKFVYRKLILSFVKASFDHLTQLFFDYLAWTSTFTLLNNKYYIKEQIDSDAIWALDFSELMEKSIFWTNVYLGSVLSSDVWLSVWFLLRNSVYKRTERNFSGI